MVATNVNSVDQALLVAFGPRIAAVKESGWRMATGCVVSGTTFSTAMKLAGWRSQPSITSSARESGMRSIDKAATILGWPAPISMTVVIAMMRARVILHPLF